MSYVISYGIINIAHITQYFYDIKILLFVIIEYEQEGPPFSVPLGQAPTLVWFGLDHI